MKLFLLQTVSPTSEHSYNCISIEAKTDSGQITAFADHDDFIAPILSGDVNIRLEDGATTLKVLSGMMRFEDGVCKIIASSIVELDAKLG